MMSHILPLVQSCVVPLLAMYVVFLLVSTLGVESAMRRRNTRLDFVALLDKLVSVRAEGALSSLMSKALDKDARRWKVSEAKELLRRMECNAGVFVELARLHGSESVPWKRDFLRDIRKERIRLKLCACCLRTLPSEIWWVPIVAPVLEAAARAYWAMVHRLNRFYSLHEASCRCSALETACDLAI